MAIRGQKIYKYYVRYIVLTLKFWFCIGISSSTTNSCYFNVLVVTFNRLYIRSIVLLHFRFSKFNPYFYLDMQKCCSKTDWQCHFTSNQNDASFLSIDATLNLSHQLNNMQFNIFFPIFYDFYDCGIEYFKISNSIHVSITFLLRVSSSSDTNTQKYIYE